ncbi:MAG TPA: cytidylate kinase-like family protein [Rectinemataceae bacterium]|nr:cytidylate kinase-like family protein [Rectinemataceae bacterium]
MAVITFSREFGSGGGKMAEGVARELGYHFVDKHSIGKIMASYGLVTFSEEYESTLGFWATFDGRIKEMFGMLDRVTRSIARHGNAVILGRGSFAVLCGFSDVLNVRIKAPFDMRVGRIMAENSVAERSRAELMVREGDRIRSSFVQSMYGLRWDASSSFDLVVDLGKLSPEAASAFIVGAAKSLEKSLPAGPRARDIEPDRTLDQTVAEALGCGLTHS